MNVANIESSGALVNYFISYHGRDSEVSLVHFLGEPINLPPGVAEDDGLGDGQSLVEVAEGVQFPFLALDGDVKLADTLKGEFLLLDEDADGVSHESSRHLENLCRHGGREQHDLDVGVEVAEHIVDLVLEATRQHLVSLVQDKHLDLVGAQHFSGDHVEHPARST